MKADERPCLLLDDIQDARSMPRKYDGRCDERLSIQLTTPCIWRHTLAIGLVSSWRRLQITFTYSEECLPSASRVPSRMLSLVLRNKPCCSLSQAIIPSGLLASLPCNKEQPSSSNLRTQQWREQSWAIQLSILAAWSPARLLQDSHQQLVWQVQQSAVLRLVPDVPLECCTVGLQGYAVPPVAEEGVNSLAWKHGRLLLGLHSHCASWSAMANRCFETALHAFSFKQT